MSRGPKVEELTFSQNALAYEVRDRIGLGDEREFLLTDTNTDWSDEDRAVVADFFERHDLAAEFRARGAAS